MSPQAKIFLEAFSKNRAINKEFYSLVPEDKLDFRMVDTPERKSDSPRESIVHQVYVTRNYIHSVEVGEYKWSDERYEQVMKEDISGFNKQQLLVELKKTEKELVGLLSHESINSKQVKVSKNSKPISFISSLWGLNNHEILHMGWNLAIMDHLDIPRFQKLKEMWG